MLSSPRFAEKRKTWRNAELFVWKVKSDGIVPQKIVLPINCKHVTNVSLGGQHAGLITATKELFMWGDNTYGQLGIGTIDHNELSPALVNLKNSVSVTCGGFHTAVKADGDLYVFGRNSCGQLGINSLANERVPVLLNTLPQGSRVVSFSCGFTHCVALLDSGRVFTWGSNSFGQLGCSTDGNKALSPHELNCFGERVSLISSESCVHTGAVTESGKLFMWGLNRNGQLGFGDTITRRFPEQVPFKFGSPICALLCQVNACAVALESGDFFAWGNIGDHWENKSSVTSPRLFSSPTPGKLTALSFGDNSDLFTWKDLTLRDNKCTKLIASGHGKSAAAVLCAFSKTVVVMTDNLPTWPELKLLLVGWLKDKESCIHHSKGIPLQLIQFIVELSWGCQLPAPLKIPVGYSGIT